MVSTISDRWAWFKGRFTPLPVFVRRTHRVVAVLWIISFIVSGVASAANVELPGPSIPAIAIVAAILSGSYLQVRPWIHGSRTVSERLHHLTEWDMPLPAAIRRIHRIVSALWVLLIFVAISFEVAGSTPPQALIIPVALLLLFVSVTGLYMLLRPWVQRFRG